MVYVVYYTYIAWNPIAWIVHYMYIAWKVMIWVVYYIYIAWNWWFMLFTILILPETDCLDCTLYV